MTARRLFALNLAGNAVLVGLMYYWLGIPDRRTWQLVASALLAAGIATGALWLHATNFRSFGEPPSRPIRQAMLALAGVALVFGIIGWFTSQWAVRWLLLPVIAIPLASGLARGRFGPWTARGALAYIALFAAGVFVPYKLVSWVPQFGSLSAQAISMTVRFTIAYLLATACLLALAWCAAGAVMAKAPRPS